MQLGVTCGSGLYDFFEGGERCVKTPFGESRVLLCRQTGRSFFLIHRHGKKHTTPPHMINHRANIWALRKLGATHILGVSCFGIISRYKPGDIVLVEDFISLTPPPTFFDIFAEKVVHTDFTEPYSKDMCKRVLLAAKKANVKIRRGGVLIGVSGPRLETKAEIAAFRKLGANIVGMTTVNEAILAKEAGLDYANIGVCSNYAAGIRDSVDIDDIILRVRQKGNLLRRIVITLLSQI
ncbi:MAG: MTAP family purine nucleoside phosphorylase [Candidatus Micrarchaeia archaeon]